MIGDGINDSPALSAADVGIAISDGAEIAREIADVTVGADNLYQIVTLKQISNALMKRIHTNYRRIVAINAGLIVLGVAGVIQPTTSALLHNSSTLVISLPVIYRFTSRCNHLDSCSAISKNRHTYRSGRILLSNAAPFRLCHTGNTIRPSRRRGEV